jgi:hypothetical protein
MLTVIPSLELLCVTVLRQWCSGFVGSTATSSIGSVINNNNNNFSNITVSGTTIAGWVNTDAGNGSKTIQGNTLVECRNWNNNCNEY